MKPDTFDIILTGAAVLMAVVTLSLAAYGLYLTYNL